MFSKKKDITHRITAVITGGPEQVEQYLGELIKCKPASNQYDRYSEGIAVLEREQLFPAVAFLLGYFHLQAGSHAVNQQQVEEHYEQAVSFFEKYARAREKNCELKFFALWQAGLLRKMLKEPWPDVEEILLKALEADPVRGESVGDVLYYYITTGQWRIAYIYSSYCMEQFHGKNPAATRSWCVNQAFYDCQILDYHTHVCISLNKKEEAANTYSLLNKLYGHQPQAFTPDSLERMSAYQAILGGMNNKDSYLKAV